MLGVGWENGKWVNIPFKGLSGDSDGNESTCSTEDLGSNPGLGRSPGEETS